jgi:membrane associated rhomboid family serine protease
MSMSTNGANQDDPDKKSSIIRFPSRDEREKLEEKKKRAKEKINPERAQAHNAHPPFINFQNISPFTGLLTASFILIHVAQNFLTDEALKLEIVYRFGFIPGAYTGAFDQEWGMFVAPLSHAFLHGSWMHLLFNVVMGLSLGMFFEKTFGSRKTMIFFTLCTIAGALTYMAFSPFSVTPMIGASGGISGYFGACLLMMHQQGRIGIGGKGPWPVLIFWGIFMSVPGILMGEPVAWQAHLGGYACGLALLLGMQRGKVKF